jgi:CheY-like chemotaxis protein
VHEGTLAGTSVLVVDDDFDTREMLASVLRTAGALVHTASSAEEGFNIAIEVRPDALVSDIAMPGQDGYSLMRQLNTALGSNSPRATVALTAFAGPADENRAAEAGFSRHVAKPFDPLALVELLTELLSPRRSLLH